MIKKVKKKPEKKKVTKETKKDSIEIKVIKEDSKPIKTIDEDEIVRILPQTIQNSSPILEKVANAEDRRNLEQELAAIQLSSRKREVENEVDYSTISTSDYISTNNTRNRTENESQFENTNADYSQMFEDSEEREGTRRVMGQGDLTQSNENNSEIEKSGFARSTKETRSTRKYVSKGDYK